MIKKKIAIIGAGMAGLSLASMLNSDWEVTLFDKARGVGGRVSSRHAHPFYFDHATQYITVCDERFRNFLQPIISAGYLQPWYPLSVIVDGDTGQVTESETNSALFVGVPGMNVPAKELARGKKIHLATRIASLKKQNGLWSMVSDQGEEFGGYDWLVLTAPAKQTAELLPDAVSFREKIEKVEMLGRFSLLLGFESRLNLVWQVAEIHDSLINRAVNNSTKPGRNNQSTSLVLQSDEEWAQSNIQVEKTEISRMISAELKRIFDIESSDALYSATQRWLYSITPNPLKDGFLIDSAMRIGVCADWCIKSDVEGAFLSASLLFENLQ